MKDDVRPHGDQTFGDALPLTGVILTKADGDARGGDRAAGFG